MTQAWTYDYDAEEEILEPGPQEMLLRQVASASFDGSRKIFFFSMGQWRWRMANCMRHEAFR